MAQLWIMVISVSPDNEGLIRTLGSFAQYARGGRLVTLYLTSTEPFLDFWRQIAGERPVYWRRALGLQPKFNSVAFTHIVIPEAVSAAIYDQTRGDRKPDDVTSQRVRVLKIYLAVEFEPTENPFYISHRMMAQKFFWWNSLLRQMTKLKRKFDHELLIEYAPGQCLKAGIKLRSVGDSKPEIRIDLLNVDDIRVRGVRWMYGAGLPEELNIKSLNWTLMDLLNVLLTYQPGYYGVENPSLEYGFGVMQQLWIALSLLEDQCFKATLKYLQLRSSSYDFNLYKSPGELVRQLDMKRLMSKPGASSPAPLPQDGPEAHFSDLHAGQDAIV